MKFSKKEIKADLKEYSNEATKGINDFIVQHPKVMAVVIDAAKRAIDEKSFTDWLQEALTGEGMEEGVRKEVKWEELGWAWFNTVNRETTEPTSTDIIEQLPTLDKPKKIDELLEQLSKEKDPTKKEKIKQHIDRIKRAKLLRADELGEPMSPIQPAIDRGQKEVSKYDSEYIFLVNLVKLVTKEGVPPQEVKDLAASQPFHTIDDIGDLTAKIWTLATTKYNVPREWLIKNLPEKKIKADLWPAQEASEVTLTQSPGAIAYNNPKDTSVSGPNPNDVVDEDKLWDIVLDQFFGKHLRWSEVIKSIRSTYPNVTDEVILSLKDRVRKSLDNQMGMIGSKKDIVNKCNTCKKEFKAHSKNDLMCPKCQDETYFKKQAKRHLNMDQVIKILDSKDNKVDHIDFTTNEVELLSGERISFDEATKRAVELDKEGTFQGSEFSTTDWNVNPTLDLGPFSSPADSGAKDQCQPFPNTGWLPADDENKDEQPSSNVASSLDRPFSKKAYGVNILSWAINDPEIRQYFRERGLDIRDIKKSLPYLGISYWNDSSPVQGNEKEITVAELRNQGHDLENSVNAYYYPPTGEIFVNPKRSLDDARDTIKHELEHALQDSEGILRPSEEWQETPYDIRTHEWGAELPVIRNLRNKGYSLQQVLQYVVDKYNRHNQTIVPMTVEDMNDAYRNKYEQLYELASEVEPASVVSNLNKQAEVIEIGLPYVGAPLRVIVNPTHDEAMGALKRTEHGLRYLTDDDDNSFIWPSWNATHEEVARKLRENGYKVSNTDSAGFLDTAMSVQYVFGSLNKKANPSTRYWIAPDGTEFPVSGIHPVWLQQNDKILKQYGINPKQATYEIHKQMVASGWSRISTEGSGFQIEIEDLSKLPSYLDDFIAKNFSPGDVILIGNGRQPGVHISDPFPSIQKAVNKALRNPVNASKKQASLEELPNGLKVLVNPTPTEVKGWFKKYTTLRAIIEPTTGDLFVWDANEAEHNSVLRYYGLTPDWETDDGTYLRSVSQYKDIDSLFGIKSETLQKLSGSQFKFNFKKQAAISGHIINDIIKGIELNGGITYNMQKGNLQGSSNYAVSIYPDKEIIIEHPIDFDQVENYIVSNEDLLSKSENSFGAWVSGDKVYLDVIVTVSDKQKALNLARTHNQLAIYDLAQGKEIPTGIVRAFNKQDIIKKAEESELSEEDQNQIAAKWCPAMNLALSNYASAVKNGHETQRAFDYALQSISNIDSSIKESALREAINTYLGPVK